MPVIVYPKTAATPERLLISRDCATALSLTHTGVLAIPGERTGVAAKLGERRLFKVAPRKAASNDNISFWLSGGALDSGQAGRQFKSPSVFFLFSFLSAVRKFLPPVCFSFYIFLPYCCTYDYCSSTVVHTWWVRGLLVNDFFFCVLCFTAVPGTTY